MSRRYASSRFFGVVVVFVLGFGALTARLAWVQVVRADHWKVEAEGASNSVVEEPADRGRILDSRGGVLAASETWYRVGVSHPQDWRIEGDVERLGELLGLPRRDVASAVAQDKRHVVLGEFRLDESDRQALVALGSITFDRRIRRVHPHGEKAKALLGQVSMAGQGLTGLEEVHDVTLAGRPGRVVEVRDAHRNLRERRVVDPPQHGPDLVLTLEPQVQAIVERELAAACIEAESDLAQAIVMDPRTGDVIASAQVPALPGESVDGEEVSNWRVVATTDVFEPGSVSKIFTAASLLSHGVSDTAKTFDGMRESKDQRRSRKTFEGGFTIRDVHPVGKVSLRHAFVRSSNIVFATAAFDLLKREEFYEDLSSYGFGRRLGLGLPGETRGILRSPDDPLWSLRTQATLAIGQEIGVNLMQLAAAASAVLTDGTLHRPRFVSALRHRDGSQEEMPPVVVRRNLVDPVVAEMLRAMCVDVVEQPYGTGRHARVDGLRVGGKTGTAQVATRTGGYLPGVYNATFVGFAPAHDPQLVIVIALHRAAKRDVSGGGAAAPVFGAIVREIASTTDLLDAGVGEMVEAVDTVRTPDLRGRSVEELRELALRAPWGAALPSLPDTGRVVGQLPPPGTPMRPDAALQLAFARGSR